MFPEDGEGVVLEVAERCLDNLEGVQVIHNLLLGGLTHEDSVHGLLDHGQCTSLESFINLLNGTEIFGSLGFTRDRL
jgi:hypothetical protein